MSGLEAGYAPVKTESCGMSWLASILRVLWACRIIR